MKKRKWIVGLVLGILMTVIVTAIPASAKNLVSTISDLAKFEAYYITRPQELIEVASTTQSGNLNEISNIVKDPEMAEITTKALYFATFPSNLIKTSVVTASPENTERFIVPTVQIQNPSAVFSQPSSKFSGGSFQDNFVILSNPTDSGLSNQVVIQPLFAYKNQNDELVLIGNMENYTTNLVIVDGVSYIGLTNKGKSIGSGNASKMFETPMKLSTKPPTGINKGVYNGLPNICYIVITFEPGTYDETIKVSDLDDLEMLYSLNYTPIQ